MEKHIQTALNAARAALEIAHISQADEAIIRSLHAAVNALLDAKCAAAQKDEDLS